jgi:hypothetical protein
MPPSYAGLYYRPDSKPVSSMVGDYTIGFAESTARRPLTAAAFCTCRVTAC